MNGQIRYLVFAVAFVVAVLVGGIHAIDLEIEWLSVRAASDGLPLTTTTSELADIYAVEGRFLDVPDASTPAQLLIDLPLLAIPYEALPIAAGLLLFVSALAFGKLTGLMWWMPLVLLSYPGVENLRHGQFGFAIAALLAWTLSMDDDWKTGLPLGLAVAIKVNLWFMLPALYLVGRRRAALGGLAMAVSSNVAGLLLLPGVTLEGLAELAHIIGTRQASTGWNGSIVGALNLPWWSALLIGAVLLVPVSRAREPVRLAIPLALLAAPVAIYFYLPVLLIAASRGAIFSLLAWWAVPWIHPIDAGLIVLVSTAISLMWTVSSRDRNDSPAFGSSTATVSAADSPG